MRPAATYDVTEVLRDDQRAAIYRGIRSSDRHPVIIKMLGPARRRPRDLDRLRNEYEVVSHLDLPSVVRPIAFGLDAGKSGIVFDDYGGRSLDQGVALPLELERFLALAVKIAGALADIHAKGIVHKDIKPENILVHPETGEVKLTDFELASLIPREHVDAAVSPQRIEGSLPYMSPEQTGRTRHAVDHRTDLYSLGVTLYQLRAGRLPLEASDPLGWMHCHLAMTPIPLRQAAPGTPDVVSDIVAKLLAKEPEDRYASALGVLHDLRRCLDALRHGRIEAFALGERDASAEFRIPARLYGRRREAQTLLAAFDRVAASGAPSLVLVGGNAGVGKSALVGELHASIVRERGLFLAGKFDQYQRGIPFSTLARAFGAWLRDLMTENEAVIAKWRVRLCEAIGSNARVVVDLIPELAKLVDAPPVAAVSLEEAERRFRLVLPQFLSAFAEQGCPLTLFLDDLQWADAESLALIEDMLTQPETKYVLIVGAYRDNEVSASHPLRAMLDAVRKSGIDVVNLSLGPLSQAHTRELVADALHTSAREAEPLANLIERRTAGNPFFTVQLLAALHEAGLLQFDPGAGAFRWDLEQIQTRGFAQDVVELMIERLRALPPATQAALEVAACIGNVFDLRSVARVRGRSIEAMQAELWEAVRTGVVLRTETSYRFLHDRIHEAAIALIPAEQRSELHLSIGRMLLSHIPAARRSEHVFEIVSQLNQAAGLIHDRAERTLLAELNLQAGEKARASTAYGAAVSYCTAGIDLLPEDAWQSQRPLAYALHLEHAQSAYLNDSFDLAESLLADLIAHCQTVVERAAPCSVGIQLHTARGDLAKAVGLTTEYLCLTGFDLSRTPTRQAVDEEYRRVIEAIGDRAIEDLVHLPQMTDPEQNALVSVLSVALPAALFADDQLFALLSCHGVRQTLAHGTSDAAPVFYVAFAMVSGAFFGRYRDGYRLGQLALELLRDRNQAAVQASVSMIFGFLLSYWVEPIEEMFPHLERSIRTGIESGNITYACFSAANLVVAKLTAGQSLPDVESEAVRQLDFVRRMGFAQEADDILTSRLFIQRMRGQGALDESAVGDQIAATEIPIYRCLYFIRDIEMHVLYRRYPEALAAARCAEPLLWSAPNFMQVADYVFFTALALAQSGVRQGLDEHQRRLREWAASCPANFEHRAALLAAEIARLDARDSDAGELYEHAMRAARDRGLPQLEALACELAAEFYAARDRAPLARAYREEARNAYARWGAEGKVRELERRDPSLAPPLAGASETFAAGPTELNLLSVVKASQTISRELVHGDLASTLLRVVLEQSGAQRGCLVLVRDLSVTVEAVAEARGGSQLLRFPALPVASSDLVPRRLIDRVIASRERVVVEDVAAEPEAVEDADYITRFRPRSALCVPILRQARVIGCLYLENSLLCGSFTPERLDVLELLASQAAISLDNAYLLQRELTARKAAEEARERAAFLAEIGSVLSESLDVDVVLEQVARAAVRSLADWIMFDRVERGALDRRVGAHRDPTRAGLIQELARRYPASPGSPHAANEVMRSRRPMLVPEVTDEFLFEHSVDAEHRRLIRAVGCDTGVIVPLQARDQVIGAVTLGAQRPRRFGPLELQFAEELARRAALAIDNATLYQEARAAVRQRDEFLSIASHELRTPLTSLLLATQAMRQLWSQGRADAAAFPRSMEIVERQCRRLEAQVDDLLDITRMEAGKLRLECADVDLVEITAEVLARFEHDLKQAQSVVALEAPSPVRGRWDPSRLAQVVSNLLSNAIKFGRGRPIEISVSAAQGRAQLVVTDHGIGFDPAQQARIFDRYARAASARHFGGLGLGLHICRQIVEAHHGTISGSGAPGVGARFSVELPQHEAVTPGD